MVEDTFSPLSDSSITSTASHTYVHMYKFRGEISCCFFERGGGGEGRGGEIKMINYSLMIKGTHKYFFRGAMVGD